MSVINDYILKDRGYSNYENTVDLPRHRWYYYKEGFSPHLVEKAIENSDIRKDDLIIDPFNGSGTTTLTASLNGYQSIGIEVNPFTSFLSDTKIRNANVKKLKEWHGKLIDSSDKGADSPLLKYSTFSQNDHLKKWLFNDSVLNSFEGGWQLTDEIKSYDIKKITRLALIISAVQNCNARRDGKCFRYRPNWEENGLGKESFLQVLSHNLDTIIEDIDKQTITQKANIITGDCRTKLKSKSIEPFKLCVTSPPYLNTFDYTDIYRPELFLGKFVFNNKDLYKLRLKTVRSHIQAKWKAPTQSDFGFLYQETMAHVNNNIENLMSKNIPMMIQAYFEDIFNILKLLKQKAVKDAQIWLVVSNSAYADKQIPVDLIIGDIGTKAGWYLKEIGVLRYLRKRKTKYSTNVNELRESVVIFSNSKP